MTLSNLFSLLSSLRIINKMINAAVCGRSKRLQKAAGTPACLSDVYKNSTRAKRRQADTSLSGRSMVEMLGVLAIIGILSVGAIAGYSKAMMKYKLNKSLEQINHMFNLTYRYLFEFKFDEKLDTHTYLIQYFIALGKVPEDMIKPNENIQVYDKLNNRIKVYINKAAHGETVFEIQSSNLETGIAQDFCYNVMRLTQSFYNDIIYVKLVQQSSTYYKGGKGRLTNYPSLKGVNFLQKCSEGKTSAFIAYIFFANTPGYD